VFDLRLRGVHTVLIPSGISPAQTGLRIALSPRATASNRVSASSHAACSMPSMSLTETRQEGVSTFGLQERLRHLFA
jgi:hypothetical protein